MMDIREDIKELMDLCIGCGRCTEACPSNAHGGCDPMDVMLGGDSWEGCIGCGSCTDVCGVTDPKKVMMYTTAVRTPVPIPGCFRDTGYNLPPGEYPYDEPEYEESGLSLMPGCIINAGYRYLENAAVSALRYLGMPASRYESGCCVYPVPYRIMTDDERDGMKKDMLKGYGRIVTLCGGCSHELTESGGDAEHIVWLLHRNLDRLPDGGLEGLKVAIQPGCRMRPILWMYREICERLGAEVMDVEPGCCGKGTKVRDALMGERQRSMESADAVIVGCPACFMWYDTWEGGIPVLHIAEAVAVAAGDRRSLGCHRIAPEMP